jgi:peptidyl-prolyl cis-trans isomerase SurA
MKKIVAVLLIAISAFTLKAQEKESVLLTIGGKDVTLMEFNAIFNKNNTKNNITEAAINEYLDLYIKFKLKVREAEELGYDTLPGFKKELAGYRKQLAQPYLTDKNVTEALIKEAYERMKFEIRASHILVRVDAEADAKDTLLAYNKIMSLRKRAVKGEDFNKIIKEVTNKDYILKTNQELSYWTNPKESIIDAQDLGYFSALQMVYPFETAVYNTKVGDVSKPIRTRFGYHIVKVVDKRPARGTLTTAHIMIKASAKDAPEVAKNSESKINEIYEKLTKENADFAVLAKQFSQDPGSARRGGELPKFTTGKMVEEFETAAFALKKDGDFSKPFKTQFGWHIVKRLSYEPLGSYEDLYNVVKSKVSRDSRSNKSKEALLKKIKEDNNFKEYIKERNDFYKLITKDEFYTGTWDVKKANNYKKVMFGFYAKDGDKVEYTQTDFANLLANQKPINSKISKESFSVNAEINRLYKKVIEKTAINFKDERLPKTNNEFRLLMQEYRDGILLFDLTDKKVWSKAVKDTTGLKEFYEKNKNNYMWGERVDATIYVCSTDAVAEKVAKLIKNKAKKGYTNADILKMVNTESQLDLTIKEGKFTKEDNEDIAKATWKNGTTSIIKNEKNTAIVFINKVLAPAPKQLNEVRGLVTSDYQNFLEEEWVKALKAKYEVVVNKEVLKLVK